MNEQWEIVPEKSKEYLLEIKDPDGWYYAQVKWDGCVQYFRYYNTPMGVDIENDKDCDYIHICSVDEEIARLQALKRMAYKYFEQYGRADHNWEPDVVESTLFQAAGMFEINESRWADKHDEYIADALKEEL